MSHLTSITPACSTIRLRIYGDSGKGPVTTLPKGSVIATYALFPTGYNVKQNSPILAGIPDGWSMPNGFDNFAAMLKSSNVRSSTDQMKKSFVPMVLADDLCVRKHHMQANWTEVHASVVLSGVGELFGKFCKGRGCNSGLPGVMFPAGSEIFCYVELKNTTLNVKLCASPSVAFSRACEISTFQYTQKIGEFVHSPLKLSFDDSDQVSSVFVDAYGTRTTIQPGIATFKLERGRIDAADYITRIYNASAKDNKSVAEFQGYLNNQDKFIDAKIKIREHLVNLVNRNVPALLDTRPIQDAINNYNKARIPTDYFFGNLSLTVSPLANAIYTQIRDSWIKQTNTSTDFKEIFLDSESTRSEYLPIAHGEGHGGIFVV